MKKGPNADHYSGRENEWPAAKEMIRLFTGPWLGMGLPVLHPPILRTHAFVGGCVPSIDAAAISGHCFWHTSLRLRPTSLRHSLFRDQSLDSGYENLFRDSALQLHTAQR